VSYELTPSDTVRLDREKVLGFATESGGKESHAAILARSLGIPAVLGLEGLLSKVTGGETLIVDGNTGIVVVNPPGDVIRNYEELQRKYESYQANLHDSSLCLLKRGRSRFVYGPISEVRAISNMHFVSEPTALDCSGLKCRFWSGDDFSLKRSNSLSTRK
jgi:phosphoenolpyruvate-protein kinase (PTS system EI component)